MKPEQILKRFTHIDGGPLSCRLGFGTDEPFLKISFYAWWEHPKYIEALEKNKKWAFSLEDDSSKEMVIYPKDIMEFKVTSQEEVIDIDFPDSHPALWKYQDQGTIFINSKIEWENIVAGIKEHLNQYFQWKDIYGVLDPRSTHTPPYAVTQIPAEIFERVVNNLEINQVKYHISHKPAIPTIAKIFVINGEDYIIAKDFDIVVPDFEHRAAWYTGE